MKTQNSSNFQRIKNGPNKSITSTRILLYLALFLFSTSSWAQSQSQTKWERFEQSQKINQSDFLESIKTEKGIKISKESLKIKKVKSGKKEMMHHSYQQIEKGVPIDNAYLTYHSIHGNIIAGSNNLIDGEKLPSPIAGLNKDQAIQKAIANIGADRYAWEDTQFEQILKKAKNDPEHSSYPSPELCFFNPAFSNHEEDYILAYKMEVFSLNPQSNQVIYIDANHGQIVHSYDLIQNACISGTPVNTDVTTLYYNLQNIDANNDGGQFELIDCDRDIETYIMQNGSTDYTASNLATDNNAGFTNFDSPAEQAALSIHWATEATYDFFLNLGIESFDSESSLIINYVNFGGDSGERNNAFWNGSFLTYGAGPLIGESSSFTGQIATTDVVSHEFGHAITQNHSMYNIGYYGESGAIHEAYSDIISAAVDNEILATYSGSQPIDPWIIGEAVTASGLRSMSAPKDFGQPDTYQGTNWKDTSAPYTNENDKGGVHTNSGVMNYWFYLISEGGAGTNDFSEPYNIAGIGIENAFAIILESYNYISIPDPSFAELRKATILASEILFDCMYSQVVIDAWDAVNVGVGEISGECLILASIDNPSTQVCSGVDISYSSTNSALLEEWFVDDVAVSNPISFPSEGVYRLKLQLTDNVSSSPTFGSTAADEVLVYVTDCEPIVDDKGVMYFSHRQILDFRSGVAVMGSNTKYFAEANISQTNADGDLLFYVSTNGPSLSDNSTRLYDADDNIVSENLTPIGHSAWQIGFSLANPDGNLHNVFMTSGHGQGLYRMIVHNDGTSIWVDDPDAPLMPVLPPTDTDYHVDGNGAMRAYDNTIVIPSCNDQVFWVLVSAVFPYGKTVIFKLDYSSNIEGELTHHSTEATNTGSSAYRCSRDGETIISNRRIFEFDRTNGVRTHIGTLPNYSGTYEPYWYGTFSPDGRYYYVQDRGNLTVYQFDLLNTSNSNILGEPHTYGGGEFFLGPDDKVYIFNSITKTEAYISVVNQPNLSVLDPNFGYNRTAFSISAPQILTATFSSYMEAEIFSPETVDFDLLQTGCYDIEVDATPCLANYTWNFGDGSDPVTDLDITTHTYELPGTYTVTFTTLVNGGTPVTVEKDVTVGFDEGATTSISGPTTFCHDGFESYSAPPNYTYNWTVTGDVANVTDLTAQTIYVTWGEDDIYTIEVELTDVQGCTETTNIVVEKDPTCCEIPFVCRSRNKSLGVKWFDNLDCAYEACEGENVQLMIRPINGPLINYTFEWSGGTVNSPHIITPDGSGYYTVTITDDSGCIQEASFLYEETCCGIPNYCRVKNITQGKKWKNDNDCYYLGCDQDDVRLMIRTVDQPVSDYTYTWSNGTPDADFPHIITPDGPGIYTVTITSSGGCTEVSSFIYETECCGFDTECRVKNITQGLAWTDVKCKYTGCDQDDVRIMIRPENGPVSDYTYVWSGGIPTGSPHIIEPYGAGIYTVTITSNGGCTEVKSFKYKTKCCGIPTTCSLKNISQDTDWEYNINCSYLECEEDDIMLRILPNNGPVSNYTFQWSGGIPTGSPHIIKPDGPGTYTVTITSNAGCTAVSSITFETQCCEIPTYCRVRNYTQGMPWTDDDDCLYESCAGDNVRLMIRPVNGSPFDYTYVWNAGTPAGSDHKIIPDGPGIYTVTITSSTGCTSESSIEYLEESINLLQCKFNNFTEGTGWVDAPDCSYTSCEGDDVNLYVQINPYTSTWTIEWSNGTPVGNSPGQVITDGPGDYTLTVTTPDGCQSSKTFTLIEEVCCEEDFTFLCTSKNVTQGSDYEPSDDCSYTSCIGDEIHILVHPTSVSPDENWTWEWSAGIPTNEPFIIIAEGSGDYTVTLTDPNDCEYIETFTITEEQCCTSCYCGNGNKSDDPDPNDNDGVLLSELIADGVIELNGNDYVDYDCFAVNGQLDMDVSFYLGPGTFNMFPGSKIVIKSGITVLVDGTTFMGCTSGNCAQMWHGIEVEEGATLITTEATFKDAQYAINLIGAAEASVFNTNFTDNFIGVYHLGTLSSANDPTLIFEGNTVNGTGTLKAPFPGQYTHPETIDLPFAGVYIVKDGVVDIGAEGSQYGTNTFTNIHNGIVAISGAITTRNNIFENISTAPVGTLFNPFDKSGFGILVSGNLNANHKLDQKGFGTESGDQATFSNCTTAISISNCGIESRDNKMEAVEMGVEVTDNDVAHNRTTLIYDNLIHTVGNAIRVIGNYSPTGNGGNPGYLAGNIIYANPPTTTIAIAIDYIQGDDGFSVYDNSITLQSDGNAMLTRYSSDLLFHDNIVYYESSMTSGLGYQFSTGISAISNQFIGCSAAGTGTCDLGFKDGISTIFGDDYYFECNEFEDLRVSISILSPCTAMTADVRNNTFSNYCTGIKFDFCGTGGCTDNTNVFDFAGSANNQWLTPPICTDFGEPEAAIFVTSCIATNPTGIFQISDEYVNVDPYYPLDYLSPAGEGIWFAPTTDDLPSACAPCPELVLNCKYNNTTQETGWFTTGECTYTACENDEVLIQIVTTQEPNPAWTWEWSAGTPTTFPFVITATGPGDYTVTMTDENECTYVQTFTLTDEVCCTNPDIINPDYDVILEIRDVSANGCYVTLANPEHYLFNFCDEMICCPTGIQSYSGTYKIWSNGIQTAAGGFTKSGSICTAEGNYTPISGLSSALNVCGGNHKVEPGDLMTATFSITEIVTECDLNIESFTLTPEPLLLTLEDITSCCENPDVLDCSYSNTSAGSGWINSSDCSYLACEGDEVSIRMVTAQTPDPAWTWAWSAGTSTSNPYEIIADGPGEYTVTLTDTQGGTSVKTFTLTEEVCCDQVELFYSDPPVEIVIYNWNNNGCYTLLDFTENYIFDFCDAIECCPTGIDSFNTAMYTYANGVQISQTLVNNYSPVDQNWCDFFTDVTGTISDAVNVCTANLVVGDVITIEFQITEIKSECELDFTSLIIEPDPLVLTEDDINACCDNLPEYDPSDESSDTEFTFDSVQGNESSFTNTSISKIREASKASEISINAYPNPFNETFTLALNTIQSEKFELKIFDKNGRLVKKQSGELLEGANQIEISDLYNLIPGIYIYQVQTGTELLSGKVFKYE